MQMNSNTNKIKNENLASDEVKNLVLQFLYTNVDIDVKYTNLTSEDQLQHIAGDDYVICPRYDGVRSWIIFMKHNNHRYAVNLPVHSQFKKLNLNIHIYPIEIAVSEEMYAGTILEGVYFCMENVRHLVIDEVYLLGGSSQLTKTKEYRLEYASNFLKNNTMPNPSYKLIMSQIYKPTKKDLTKCYEKLKNNPSIRSMTFYPNMYGNKIFSYSIVETDLIEDIICYDVFRMKRSDKPDIYYLAEDSEEEVEDRGLIAYIPDMSTSKLCKKWFTKRTKEIKVKCKMDNDNRWIPIESLENS